MYWESLEGLERVVAAKPKGERAEDKPTKQPMRPERGVRLAPSNDQKKARRRLNRSLASSSDVLLPNGEQMGTDGQDDHDSALAEHMIADHGYDRLVYDSGTLAKIEMHEAAHEGASLGHTHAEYGKKASKTAGGEPTPIGTWTTRYPDGWVYDRNRDEWWKDFGSRRIKVWEARPGIYQSSGSEGFVDTLEDAKADAEASFAHLSSSKTAGRMCGCEHVDHFADEDGTWVTDGIPRNPDAHEYAQVPAGDQSAQYVGPICDWCATNHLAQYLTSSRKQGELVRIPGHRDMSIWGDPTDECFVACECGQQFSAQRAYDDPFGEKGTAQAAADAKWQQHVQSVNKESAMRTEAQILREMAVASLDNQRTLAAELDSLRTSRTAAIQQERDIDLADTVVKAHLRPVLTHTMNTTATDWLDNVPTSSGDASLAMKTEANIWFDAVSGEVKADREEFAIQARGMAKKVAGRYGEAANSAARAFLDQAAHLYRVADASGQNGNAESGVTLDPDEEPLFAEDWGPAGSMGVHPTMPGAGNQPTATRRTAGDLDTCAHCGESIEDDDGIWYHAESMQARCDGADDEEGIGWGDLVRQAEPAAKTSRRRTASDDTLGRRRTAAEGGQTCAECGAAIERDPEGEENRTWHHNDGDSHDHEAKPKGDSKESRRRTAADNEPAWLRERTNDPYGTPNKDYDKETGAYTDSAFWAAHPYETVGSYRIFEDGGLWYGYDTRQNMWTNGRPSRDEVEKMANGPYLDVWASRTAAEGGQTCSVCGDAIAKDPACWACRPGRPGRTWSAVEKTSAVYRVEFVVMVDAEDAEDAAQQARAMIGDPRFEPVDVRLG